MCCWFHSRVLIVIWFKHTGFHILSIESFVVQGLCFHPMSVVKFNFFFFPSLSVDYDGGRWAGNKSLSINQRFCLMCYWFLFSVSIAGWFIIWGFHILSTDRWLVQRSGFNLVSAVNFEVSPLNIDYTGVQWAGNEYKVIYWKNHISLRACVIHA